MTVHSHSRAFLNDPNFLALRSHYVDHPMILYTGAGVSWARDAKFGMRGWDDFVRSALERNVAAQSNALSQYDDLVAAGETEPWELADWSLAKSGDGSSRVLWLPWLKLKRIIKGSGDSCPDNS